jgi:hypothetical protein
MDSPTQFLCQSTKKIGANSATTPAGFYKHRCLSESPPIGEDLLARRSTKLPALPDYNLRFAILGAN